MVILEYESEDGKSPFAAWFDALPAAAAAKVAVVLLRMGNGNFGDSKSVGKGVMERRIDVGPGYRVYFARDGDLIVILLAGGSKKRQNDDVEAAQARWEDYRNRKKKGGA